MKNRMKNIRRWWRKMETYDRTFIRIALFLMVPNLILVCFGAWIALSSIFWLLVALTMQIYSRYRSRISRSIGFLEGLRTQERINRAKMNEMIGRCVSLEFENGRLNSDYKKLEYDFHQYKKQIKNPKKVKK